MRADHRAGRYCSQVLNGNGHPEEKQMNWDRIEGNWKQFAGRVKQQWGKLTDNEIVQVNGNRDQLEGIIQARYGYAKDQVKKDIDAWLNGL